MAFSFNGKGVFPFVGRIYFFIIYTLFCYLGVSTVYKICRFMFCLRVGNNPLNAVRKEDAFWFYYLFSVFLRYGDLIYYYVFEPIWWIKRNELYLSFFYSPFYSYSVVDEILSKVPLQVLFTFPWTGLETVGRDWIVYGI